MKILITGGKGMLGRTLQRELAGNELKPSGAEDSRETERASDERSERGNELVIADLPEWDITDADAFTAKTLAESPDVVIHCAAMTKVDDCEAKRELAFRLNEEGTRNVALACKASGARLIAISTDYVFSGEPPREPWAWSETDIPRPRTVYGASKFAGEQMIQMILPDAVILRIAWLYGAGGPSFVHTMARLGAQEGPALKVVNDQRGNPTSTKVVADVIRFLLAHPEVSGIVHGTCEDQCTWYDLTVELFRLLDLKREVVPCTTEEFPRPAPRPRNSALKKSVLNLLGYRTPRWQDALADFVKAEKLLDGIV
jgi:dTDP-4-dehydrorhamnose reductase